jgi:hypothetical protein
MPQCSEKRAKQQGVCVSHGSSLTGVRLIFVENGPEMIHKLFGGSEDRGVGLPRFQAIR